MGLNGVLHFNKTRSPDHQSGLPPGSEAFPRKQIPSKPMNRHHDPEKEFAAMIRRRKIVPLLLLPILFAVCLPGWGREAEASNLYHQDHSP
jgi:hypothetical protein